MRIDISEEEAMWLYEVIAVVDSECVQEALKSEGISEGVLSLNTYAMWVQVSNKIKENT